MTALLLVLRKVPLWLWLAIAAALAIGIQSHRLGNAQEARDSYAQQLYTAQARIGSLQETARLQRELAADASAISNRYQGAITDANQKSNALAADLAAARKRLQVHGQCVRPGGLAPAGTNVGGSDAGTFELDAEARRNYLDLRTGIAQQRAQVIGLQERVRSLESRCRVAP